MKKRLVVIPETKPYGALIDGPDGRVNDQNEVPTVRRRAVDVPEPADGAGRYSLVFGRTRR